MAPGFSLAAPWATLPPAAQLLERPRALAPVAAPEPHPQELALMQAVRESIERPHRGFAVPQAFGGLSSSLLVVAGACAGYLLTPPVAHGRPGWYADRLARVAEPPPHLLDSPAEATGRLYAVKVIRFSRSAADLVGQRLFWQELARGRPRGEDLSGRFSAPHRLGALEQGCGVLPGELALPHAPGPPGSRLFVAIEPLVELFTLDDLLRPPDGSPPALAPLTRQDLGLSVWQAIGRALTYLAAQDVVHGAVEPSAMVWQPVQANWAEGRWVLTDFSRAQRVGARQEALAEQLRWPSSQRAGRPPLERPPRAGEARQAGSTYPAPESVALEWLVPPDGDDRGMAPAPPRLIGVRPFRTALDTWGLAHSVLACLHSVPAAWPLNAARDTPFNFTQDDEDEAFVWQPLAGKRQVLAMYASWWWLRREELVMQPAAAPWEGLAGLDPFLPPGSRAWVEAMWGPQSWPRFQAHCEDCDALFGWLSEECSSAISAVLRAMLAPLPWLRPSPQTVSSCAEELWAAHAEHGQAEVRQAEQAVHAARERVAALEEGQRDPLWARAWAGPFSQLRGARRELAAAEAQRRFVRSADERVQDEIERTRERLQSTACAAAVGPVYGPAPRPLGEQVKRALSELEADARKYAARLASHGRASRL